MILIMAKVKLIYLLFLAVFASASCSQEEIDQQVLLPSNLQVTVEKTGKGAVKIDFQAVDANFYKVSYGLPNQVPERVVGTSVVYNYNAEGTYTIRVQAHSTEADFISSTKSVEITGAELGGEIPLTGFESPLTYNGYNLVWNDEFGGSSLSSDWVFDIGDGCPNICGWGNNELEYYRQENAEVRDGFLIIKAKQENFGSRNYTSSRIKTQGKKSFTYGRIDVRAALPKGQGIWPAIWMLGENITTVNWPACGEIDIMELIGGNADGRDNTIHGTVHWDNNGNYAQFGGSKKKNSGIFNGEFHVFSIIWDKNKIVWLLDNVPYHEIDITPAALDEFRKPFFLLLNVAVGGNWPGNPNGTTAFPQQMIVDYVRVFQEK
jgi:beta-glucanase (GH16 family)